MTDTIRLLPRMSGFLECRSDDKNDFTLPELRCPYGHIIKWEFAFHEAGYPRCTEKSPNGRNLCDARLFVQFFPRLNKSANPMMFVAEISYAEIMHVTKAAMDVPAIMSYLGVTWKPEPRKAG